ncbi:MAG: hypothetical protein HY235_05675 [Acidobacteria bacterium]|nr:hypothetical protein [Acidobacteriota bacterium]
MQVTGVGVSAGSIERPKNLEEASAAFEALFLSHLLKAARDAGQGGWLGEADHAGATMMEVAEEYLAREMAQNGGLGFGRMVAAQLKVKASNAPDGANPTPR